MIIEYLNIGSCDVRIKGNVINADIDHDVVSNIDIAANALFLPFKDKSFKGVIAHHIIEHISYWHHVRFIKECRRVIKENGKISVKAPDFEGLIKNYLDNYLGAKGVWHQHIFGRQVFEKDCHKAGITEVYLTELLFKHGFYDLKWNKGIREMPELSVIATKGEVPSWEIT